MINLYYGNGSCGLSGSGARYVTIFYSGSIIIDDKTKKRYEILANSNKIRIFPTLNVKTELSELFEYVGEFRIIKAIISDRSGIQRDHTVRKIVDIAEFIFSNTEDMTILSENMNAKFTYKRKVLKTALKQTTINNWNTSNLGKDLYLDNRNVYTGGIHIHKSNMRIMTGATHNEKSKKLYYYDADGRFTITGNRHGEPNIFKKRRKLRRK